MNAQKEHWNAWLYYQQAESLLRPVNFIQSTHLEKFADGGDCCGSAGFVGGRERGGPAGGQR